ncbi:hypothetical protein AGMMS49593_08250 [Endomicrobiia bacterium]|nr:hypothetical protein AGMMS49593_08250 [Endomicrobiia bacterium]
MTNSQIREGMCGSIFRCNSINVRHEVIVQKISAYVLKMDYFGVMSSAKYWLSKYMNEIKMPCIQDILIFCIDNLTGLATIKASYTKSNHQKCKFAR